MADKKDTQLSIVIRAVDQATAKIKSINERLDATTKPIRDFKKALGDLREKSGLDDVIGGFKGVGDAVRDLLGKLLLIGGAVGLAVAGLVHLIDEFDDLEKKAERLGIGVDTLAQLRYAAEKTGAPVEALDAGVQAFSQSLGQARANTGRMAAFLEKVSPALLRQLKAAKSNEEALNLLADAMAKLQDPAKRAALAQKTLGDAALAPLFAKGAKGIKELRDRYAELAGSQEGAAKDAGDTKESMIDLKATIDGIKAAIVQGLAPALKVIVEQLSAWFKENRGRVAQFAADLGKKLPGAFNAVVDAVKGAIAFLTPFLDSTTKLKIAAGLLAAVMAGPLIAAIVGLGIAIAATPVGWIVGGLAAITTGVILLAKYCSPLVAGIVAVGAAMLGIPVVGLVAAFVAAAKLIIDHWGAIKDFFAGLWDGVKAMFAKAWEFIKGIVDKVVDAVKTVIDGAKSIGDTVFGSTGSIGDMRARLQAQEAGDVSGQARGAVAPPSSSAAKITVDFANAPRGTRVNTDPRSTADVDLSVGYQLNPGGV